jgi:hypothetical protein
LVLGAAWANDILSGLTRLLYDKSTWSDSHNYFYKIVVVRGAIDLLESAGFWWQAKTLASHLHKFMAEFYGASSGADTSSGEERGAP